MLTSLSRHLIHGTTVLSLSLILTACGGSSGGGTPTPNSSTPSAQSASAGQTSSEQNSSASSAEPVASAPASSAGTSSEPNSSEAASSSSSVQATEVSPFSFEAETSAALGALVTSNEVELEIIAGPVDISIDKGEYSLDGGSTFTADAGTVDHGDTVIVQIKASDTFSTDTSATLTAGGISGTFTVTSEAEDTTPDNFSFTPQDDLVPGAEVLSNTVTIEGINTPVAITIENGVYRINDAEAFTAEEGMVEKGDKLTVKTDMPDSANADKEVTVKVGTFTAPFLLSTVEDNEPAEAAFVFPPPMTATEGDSVIVRGTAEDELSAVVRVTLTVGTETYEVDTEDDFATWQKSVNLVPGENLISVIAEDEHGHAMEEAASVTVVRQAFADSFPDADVQYGLTGGLIFDQDRNQLLIADPSAESKIVAVNLKTAKRSVFVRSDESFEFNRARGLTIDSNRNRLLVSAETSSGGRGVFGVDLETGLKSLVNGDDFPQPGQPILAVPTGIVVDPADPDRALILSSLSTGRSLQSLSLRTGVRSIVSANDVEEQGPIFEGEITDLLIDESNSKAFVSDFPKNIIEVDLISGERKVFVSEGEPDGALEPCTFSLATNDISRRLFAWGLGCERVLWTVDIETREITVVSDNVSNQINPFGVVSGMSFSPNKEYIAAVDRGVGVVYAIDVITGERLVISKPAGEF